VLLVDTAHESGGRWQDLVNEYEDGLLGRELDSLSDHVDELADSEIRRDQVLLLVDSGNVALLDLLADYRNTIRIFLANTLGFGLALLKGMLVLKLGSHLVGSLG